MTVIMNDETKLSESSFPHFSTVFQTYQDDGWVIMKGCAQWNSFMVGEITASSCAHRLTCWPALNLLSYRGSSGKNGYRKDANIVDVPDLICSYTPPPTPLNTHTHLTVPFSPPENRLLENLVCHRVKIFCHGNPSLLPLSTPTQSSLTHCFSYSSNTLKRYFNS